MSWCSTCGRPAGLPTYFVICTGNNARQIVAIADAVRDTLKQDLGERPTLSEGVDRSEWILLDYFNFVVHVFSRECRASTRSSGCGATPSVSSSRTKT